MINKKNIRHIVVTGIASIALVAPLALGSVQPNVNANAAGLTIESGETIDGNGYEHKNTKADDAMWNDQAAKDTRRYEKEDSARIAKTKKAFAHSKAGKKYYAAVRKDEAKYNKNHKNSHARHNRKTTRTHKHSSMMNMHGTKAPKGLKQARHPKFRKGSRVIIKANHMPGMKGAKAHVVDAYDTKLYAVNYKPTNHGKTVRNHKWVVGKEIKPSRKGRIRKGERVTLKANHMKFMWNAKAKIVGIHNGPAYMVNYRQTTNHARVTNHKWLTQNELKK